MEPGATLHIGGMSFLSLHQKGYRVFGVQNRLTLLSDDIDRTSKLAAVIQLYQFASQQTKLASGCPLCADFVAEVCDDRRVAAGTTFLIGRLPSAP
jgi:hypothetical protein